DPNGSTTQYVYNAAGQRTEQIDPLGGVTQFTFDAARNTVQIVDPHGQVRSFKYDADNRQIEEEWLLGSKVIRQIHYSYDADGNLISASDPDSSYTFTYNADNRVTSVANTGTPGVPHVILVYGYDAVGNVTSVTDNSSVQVISAYDPRNLLTNLVWQ